MHVTVLIRTAETYRVQIEEPLGDLKKGAKVMLNISDIASEKDHTAEGFVVAGAHVVVGDEEQVGESLADHLRQWLDSHEEKGNDRLDSEPQLTLVNVARIACDCFSSDAWWTTGR